MSINSQIVDRLSCIFCGGNGNLETLIPSRILMPDAANVLRCHKCGLVFLESLDSREELDKEEASYWANEEQKRIYFQETVQKVFLKEFKARLDVLEKWVGRSGRLLDVGCGVGHFLAVARTRGWNARGLDISRGAREAAGEGYGLDVQVNTLENAHFQAGEFDVITLWDVIEHIRRPVENLRAGNRLLRRGGIIAMKTPNEAGLFKQMALTLYKTLGDRGAFLLKYVYYIPHYFSYSQKTMNLLLERTGFQAIRYEMDETPQEFAREKINVHYNSDPKHSLVARALPLASFLSKLVGKENKMTVYARKVREASHA
ncbi:MAG: class I SAM-dependent methyltransferase [Candidatus Omnitrophica bacterium]|nr:class I SAM-dependent methyltransferase [Candidatus Omnitrophota bacterium]